MTDMEFRNNYNKILQDFTVITKSKYKNIIKDIIQYFKKTNCCYYLMDYNMNNQLVFDICIQKTNNFSLICKITNPSILETIENCEDEAFLLQIFNTNNDNLSIYLKLEVLLKTIENIRTDYVYSKYHDQLVKEDDLLHKINVDKEIDILCRQEIATCMVCMEDISHNIYTSCCTQNICRLCVNKLEPKKCPNCREIFYM